MSNPNDSIAFLTGWAADIRASSGTSVDADCLEYAASTLKKQQAEIARLREALENLTKSSGEVHQRGASVGSQWVRLSIDLALARTALKEPTP